MKYTFSGHSGLQLPQISLGLWHNFGSEDPFDMARAMILHAWDKGVTHFDPLTPFIEIFSRKWFKRSKISHTGIN